MQINAMSRIRLHVAQKITSIDEREIISAGGKTIAAAVREVGIYSFLISVITIRSRYAEGEIENEREG